MPRGDGTGPQGQGALTGRGLGSCQSNVNPNAPIDQNQSFGQRFMSGFNSIFRGGRGGGQGRGQGGRGRRSRNR